MGQQGFEWGEQWGLEASRHSVHMWCGSSECARARAGERGGGELWKNAIVVETWNNNVLGLYAEVQDDAGRAPVWEEGERVSYKHWR